MKGFDALDEDIIVRRKKNRKFREMKVNSRQM